MKKAIVTTFLIAVLSINFGFSDEVSTMWSRLYSRAQSYEDKTMIMKGLVEIEEPSIIPFLGTALAELNETSTDDMNYTLTTRHIELTKLIVRRLGEMKAAEYADLIFYVFRNTEDIYLRAEAILALGRTVNPDYSDDIAMFLRNLNLNIDLEAEDKDSEVLALSAVLALERFRQPVGYTPLFFASIGWYSKLSMVREQAARALDSLLEDPTDMLRSLVRLESEYSVKLEALRAAQRSQAPPGGKAEIAAEAIKQGLKNEPRNAVEKSNLGQLRQLGLDMLIEYGPADSDSKVVPYLEEILFRRFDINEQLTAVGALEADGRSEAVAALVRYLKTQNERQLAGLLPADYRLVRSVIHTLGELGDPMAYEELVAVQISNWPSSVVRDAKTALGNLQ
jgi:HEAT repeat protein